MLSFEGLPSDILLQIVASLSLRDVVCVSMVCKSFQTLSKEHSFWLEPLRTTQISQPLPCPSTEDLATHTAKSLKQLALHTLRLARNWDIPFPQVAGLVRTLKCGVHNNILHCLPGTDGIMLHSLEEGTLICRDLKTGRSSEPVFVGRIIDMSSPLEERGRFTVAALVDDQRILILTATVDPVSTSIIFKRELEPGYAYSNIFMNRSIVGVARGPSSGAIEVESFNISDPSISTVIMTDLQASHIMGSAVIDDTVYVMALQFRTAFVYKFPQRLLAYSAPSPDVDYSVRRSHVARIPAPPDDPGDRAHFTDYCVLSTEPQHGRSTISVAYMHALRAGLPEPPLSLDITFWPRPVGAVPLRPAQTVTVPGSLSGHPGTAWELIVIANSGRAVVLLVDPPRPPSESGGLLPDTPPPGPAPKLMLARYDVLCGAATVHELQMPIETRDICALALDDHRGVVVVVTTDDVLHYVPYA